GRRTRRPPSTAGQAACRAEADRSSARLRDKTVRRGGSCSKAPSFRGARSANPESRDSGFGAIAPPRNDVEKESKKPHHAAFDFSAASEANVLPSAARRFSSGAGSSEGSLVSLA